MSETPKPVKEKFVIESPFDKKKYETMMMISKVLDEFKFPGPLPKSGQSFYELGAEGKIWHVTPLYEEEIILLREAGFIVRPLVPEKDDPHGILQRPVKFCGVP